MLQLLQTDVTAFIVAATVLLSSLVLHELGHALVADLVGDDTARRAGRISLDPLRHLDLMGTILLLVVGFGWAKPVPIRPDKFRHYRLGLLLVSVAGVAANLLLALLALLALRSLSAMNAGQLTGPLVLGLSLSVRINVLLVVFNLLPVPPLDGAKVVAALAPVAIRQLLFSLERFGFLLVIALLVLFPGPIFALVDRITNLMAGLILGAP